MAPLVLALPPSIEVEPVRARELIGSRSGTVVFEGDAPASGDIVTTVSRSLPRLWEIRVPVTRTAPTVQVSYEVIGADGRPNQLTSTSGQFSAVDVQLEAIPVRLRAGRTGEMILQGGVTMHLDLQQTRISGDYQGTLVVSVNRF